MTRHRAPSDRTLRRYGITAANASVRRYTTEQLARGRADGAVLPGWYHCPDAPHDCPVWVDTVERTDTGDYTVRWSVLPPRHDPCRLSDWCDTTTYQRGEWWMTPADWWSAP